MAAVAVKKKIRKSPLENDAKARCGGGRERGWAVTEFNWRTCLGGVGIGWIVAETEEDSADAAQRSGCDPK